MKFCPNCGAELKPEAKFCAACGTPITFAPPPPVQPAPQQQTYYQQQEPAYEQAREASNAFAPSYSGETDIIENVDLMRMALESLKGNWGLAIGTFLVYILVVGAISVIPVLGAIVSLILAGPMALGMAVFILSLSRSRDGSLEQLFRGFSNFGISLGAYLLMALFTFLWMLLLIIPGIIAAISYSMTFFIIADDNSIGAMAAIDKSKKMMDGFKWKYFCLGLRFIGWALLCLLTLGIGFLWLFPYIQVSFAKFYDNVKSHQLATGKI